MKRRTSKRKRSVRQQSDTPKVISVATDIAALNAEEATLQRELGELNAKTAKRYARLSGIQTRRLELMREFDSSARP